MPRNISIENNPVEQFLSEHKNVVYSFRSLKRHIPHTKNAIYFYAKNSSHVRSAEPIEVGCGKEGFCAFTYQE